MNGLWEIRCGDAVEQLQKVPAASVDCVCTSPPYWSLRDYGVPGQLGLEPSWREHMSNLRRVFAEVHRVLKPTGNVWVNYGDTVSSANGGSRDPGSWRGKGRTAEGTQPANAPNRLSKEDPRKHKLGLAWRLRFMLHDDLGFISRSDVVWHKPNSMPLSMRDRATPKYEMLFHLVKQPRYYFDLDAIRKPFSEATIDRVSQASFDSQTGGPKDYGNGMSQRRAQVTQGAALRGGDRNSWEARLLRGSKKGTAPGQKPSAIERASFNVRVRDAPLGVSHQKWGGHLGHVDATPDEIAEANERDAAAGARRDKTLGMDGTPSQPHVRLPPEPGDEGAFHPLGANPGDVWEIPVDEEDDAIGAEVWRIPNEPLKAAHFATFPKELARRAIVASCPRSVCDACGRPRQPLYDVRLADVRGRPRAEGERRAQAEEAGSHRAPGDGMVGTGRTVRTFAGFEDCDCGAPFTPGLVLDPFAGSGTTGVVALNLGLRFLGIELNPAYVSLAERRIKAESPAATARRLNTFTEEA